MWEFWAAVAVFAAVAAGAGFSTGRRTARCEADQRAYEAGYDDGINAGHADATRRWQSEVDRLTAELCWARHPANPESGS